MSAVTTAEAGPKRDADWYLRNVLIKPAMAWVLVVLAIISNIMYPGFFAWGNIENILFQNSPVGLVALGMTFVIIAGGFDLSVGAIFAGGAVMFAKLSNDMPIGLAFVITVIAGAIAGTINGVIITKIKVNPFVATLGTASLFGERCTCTPTPRRSGLRRRTSPNLVVGRFSAFLSWSGCLLPR